ncbi:MAG: hypothetical protein ABIJ09_23670 [Pseudomonadota bacterium]
MSMRVANPIRSERHVRLAAALGLMLFVGGSFCPEAQQAGSGNLDRPQGVAVFSVDNAPYALLPMPQQHHLRVFSLTSRIFVPAPNLYFPLSVPVGPYSARMAVDAAHRLAWVLDSADGSLRALSLGVAADPAAFARVGQAIPVGLAPSGVAVDPLAAKPRLWVSSARTAEVLELTTDDAARAVELVTSWPVGVQPSDLGYDASSSQLVIADAASSAVTLLQPETGAVRAIEVGGATARVKLGHAYLAAEAPDATVALVLRLDAPEIALLRPDQDPPLWARVELPDIPVDAEFFGSSSAGDASCAGLDRTEACGAAAILTQKGLIYYIELDAVDAAGRLVPRLIDEDVDLPDLSADPNLEPSLYDPASDAPDALARRPIVTTAVVEDAGTPPLVQQSGTATLLFTYQGILAPVRDRLGRYEPDLERLVDVDAEQRGVDLASVHVRVGDLVEIAEQSGCPTMLRLPVVQVSGAALVVAPAGGDPDCLRRSGGVRFSVRAGASFTVASAREDAAQSILGRVDPEEAYNARVVTLTLSLAAAGAPATSAVIAVPVRDNFSPRAVDLGLSGTLPTGLALSMVGPSEARVPRLLVTAAGGSSLFLLAPGIQGYVGQDILATGAERFE